MSLYGPEELISSPMWQEDPPTLAAPFAWTTETALLREGQERVLTATGPGGTQVVSPAFTKGTTRRFFLTMEAMSAGSSTPVRFGLRANDDNGEEIAFVAVTASTVPVGEWRVHTALVEVPEHTVELIPQLRAQSGARFHIAYVSARQVTAATSPQGYSLSYAMPASGGGEGGGPGGDIEIPPISEQARTPRPVTGLELVAGLSQTKGVIHASWQPVVRSTNDDSISGVRYDVEYRQGVEGWIPLPQVSSAQTTVTGLEPGQTYSVRVRSYFEGKSADSWIAAEAAIPVDDTPPPAPSAPVASAFLGVINHTWDGTAEGGGSMPLDWTHNEVGLRVGETTTVVSRVYGPGSGVPVVGAPVGVDVAVGYRAVDAVGNASDWTYSTDLQVKGVLDEDFGGKSLNERLSEQAEAQRQAEAVAMRALDEAEALRATSVNVEQAARQIIAEALAGMRVEAQNWATANGIERVYNQPTPPDGDPSGLWIDTDHDNRFYRWDNGWVQVNTTTTNTLLNNIENAQEMVREARTAYDTAMSKVGELDAKAIELENKAEEAQQALDQLTEDLLSMATDMDAKGRIIYSPTEPTEEADRQPQNLWIDTSMQASPDGGPDIPRNTPHRWTGQGWEEITDAAAVAAAQAAAQALDRATEAHERAGTAEQNAQAALDSVNTKNAIYFDFDPPSGQGSKEGDVWWQRGDNGAVIGMWVWLDGTWNKGDVASEMIANLDVGKLTIGAGTAIDLEVTQRFSAAIAEIIELEAKNLKAEEIWGDSAWLGQARVNMLTVGAISPDMLAMGTDELAPNPTFSNAALWNKAPFLNTGPGITSTNTQSYVDPGSNRAPWFNDLSAAGSSIPVTLPQPCAGGDRFYVSMEALHWSTVGDKVLRFEAEFFDRNMDRVSGDGPELRGSDANATAYHNRQKVVVAPATASFVRFHLTIVSGTVGQFIIRRVSVRRAMTAVSGGQRVEISPAGLALWTAAATSLPNAELTAAKGLVLRDNAGNSTMWIDSLTGELHISGGVTSGGKIIGSSFEGGDIDIRTAIGAPVFKADPNGVKIGGTIPVLQVPFNPPYSFTGTTGSLDAPAISGGVYKVTWILTRSSAVDNQFHFVGFRWLDSAGATISSFTSLHDYIAPTTVGSALAHYITLRAPERAATLRIEIWREGGTAVTTRMHSTKVELVGPGDIDIAGSVSASEGDFTRLDAEYGFIGPIRYSEDEATVHGDIEVNGRFKFIIPDPLTITGATNNQITSSGWAPLPTNVSTTFRANYPMWVEIRAGGALVIPPGGNIRLSAIVSGATIIGAIDEGGWGSTVWGQNSSSSSGNLVMTGAGSRVVLLNEGLHTIYLVAQRAADVSGSAVNYPVLQIIPLRWH